MVQQDTKELSVSSNYFVVRIYMSGKVVPDTNTGTLQIQPYLVSELTAATFTKQSSNNT